MGTFANISKKLIVQALGRQGNYKEVITDHIDVEASGCLSCPYYLQNGNCHDKQGFCSNCPTKNYIKETVYINEKNRYRVDDRLRLKCNAVKLLFYFHFLNPDSNGIITDIDLKKISQKLNVHYKTVMNNLLILHDYGYVYYCKCSKDRYNILIDGYKEQREKNGPGYMVVNEEWMSHLLKMDDINAIRILIRETMNIDNLNPNTRISINTLENSFEELRRYLPKYYKPWKIRQCLVKYSEAFSGVFETVINHTSVKLTLKPSCTAKNIRENQLASFKEGLKKFLSDLNNSVNLSLSDEVEDPRFTYMQTTTKLVPVLHLKGSEADNIAHLALRYGQKIIEDALIFIHREYMIEDIPIHNIGGLIHTFIKRFSHAYI